MDPPESRSGRPQFHKGKEIQGPRPSPLKVKKDAKFKSKPPAGPSAAAPSSHPPSEVDNFPRGPVIIYTVSPKVIHATPGEFMSIVQHLTGPSPRASPPSPLSRRFEATRDRTGDVGIAPEIVDVELDPRLDRRECSPHGILTPLPSSLPTISPNHFLPSPDPALAGFLNDLSPTIYGGNGVDWMSPVARLMASPLILSPGVPVDRFLD